MTKKHSTIYLIGRGLLNKLGSTEYEVRKVKYGKVFNHRFMCSLAGCGVDMHYAHRQAHLFSYHKRTAFDYDEVRDQARTPKEVCERTAHKQKRKKGKARKSKFIYLFRGSSCHYCCQ